VILQETPLQGAYIVVLEPLFDERGHFARTFDAETFAAHGLEPSIAQCNASFNQLAGTLRGMHYQTDPHGEAKLIRVTRGRIYDVIIDLRAGSPTLSHWFGVELDADSGRAVYAPVGFAHGFQTLVDESEVLYAMSHHYVAEAARGVRYDDPAFAIDWPEPPPGGRIVSARDLAFDDFVAP
jgi:dTDP-4-dehydrorhamnose 3,5-epimerase